MIKRLTVTLFRDLRCEFFELSQKFRTIVAIDLDREGLGKVKAENTENGFCVYDIVPALDRDLAAVILRDRNELLDGRRFFERNFNGLHDGTPPNHNFTLL